MAASPAEQIVREIIRVLRLIEDDLRAALGGQTRREPDRMSYQITISGHKATDDAAAFDAEIAERAQAFAAELEGVTYAKFSGSTASHDLLAMETPATAEPPAEAETPTDAATEDTAEAETPTDSAGRPTR